MKHCKTFFLSFLIFVLACQLAHGAVMLKTAILPSGEGRIVGSAFSPDSSRLVILRYVEKSASSDGRNTLQIVNLKTGKEVSHSLVLAGEHPSLARRSHLVRYSWDARYLVIGTEASDVLVILDAATLHVVSEISLHAEEERHVLSAGGENRYFQGAEDLAVASNAPVFGVLKSDYFQGNRAFIGSFASKLVIKTWSIGRGMTATQLGKTSLSLSEDGSSVAVTLMPDGYGSPKHLKNIQLYRSNTGELVKAIRTDSWMGPIMLLPGNSVLTSKIETPSIFSKKACIEKWNLDTEKRSSQFCDPGRNVVGAFSVSTAANRVVGYGCNVHKEAEGHVYAVEGRVDIWDMMSGDLLASSEELPAWNVHIQMSPDGSWIMADQTLLQVITNDTQN